MSAKTYIYKGPTDRHVVDVVQNRHTRYSISPGNMCKMLENLVFREVKDSISNFWKIKCFFNDKYDPYNIQCTI